MIADSFAVRCLARAGVGNVVMMTARTISAIYCLARASASGFFCHDDGDHLCRLLPCQGWREWEFCRDDGEDCREPPPPNCSTFVVWGKMGPLALGRLEGLPLMRHRSWTLSPTSTNLKGFHFRATHLKDSSHARSRRRYSYLGTSLRRISRLIYSPEMMKVPLPSTRRRFHCHWKYWDRQGT